MALLHLSAHARRSAREIIQLRSTSKPRYVNGPPLKARSGHKERFFANSKMQHRSPLAPACGALFLLLLLIMNCSLCGTALAANTKFCKQCGTLQPLPQSIANPEALDKACGKCLTLNKPQSKFCLQCGHSFLMGNAQPAMDRAELGRSATTAPALDKLVKSAQLPPSKKVQNDFLDTEATTVALAGIPSDAKINNQHFSSAPAATNHWRKWVLTGVAVLALGFTAWIALKPLTDSPLSSGVVQDREANDTNEAPPATDQERAELLVGPQGVQPLTTTTAVTPPPPAVTSDTAAPAPTPATAPSVTSVTAPAVSTPLERDTTAPTSTSLRPPARQPAQKTPSLDDLLD